MPFIDACLYMQTDCQYKPQILNQILFTSDACSEETLKFRFHDEYSHLMSVFWLNIQMIMEMKWKWKRKKKIGYENIARVIHSKWRR